MVFLLAERLEPWIAGLLDNAHLGLSPSIFGLVLLSTGDVAI
jgi:hypothetical protein